MRFSACITGHGRDEAQQSSITHVPFGNWHIHKDVLDLGTQMLSKWTVPAHLIVDKAITIDIRFLQDAAE